MTDITYTNTFANGTAASADEVNENFQDVRNALMVSLGGGMEEENLLNKYFRMALSANCHESMTDNTIIRMLVTQTPAAGDLEVEHMTAFANSVATGSLEFYLEAYTGGVWNLLSSIEYLPADAAAGSIKSATPASPQIAGGTPIRVRQVSTAYTGATDASVVVWFKEVIAQS